MSNRLSVSIIGSFRKHWLDIVAARSMFTVMGYDVLTPIGEAELDGNLEFVRLTTNDSEMSNEKIEADVLSKLERSDLVYVVAPKGYVGRTTAMEIGWSKQSESMIYYSERPKDLPIIVFDSEIISIEKLTESDIADYLEY